MTDQNIKIRNSGPVEDINYERLISFSFDYETTCLKIQAA